MGKKIFKSLMLEAISLIILISLIKQISTFLPYKISLITSILPISILCVFIYSKIFYVKKINLKFIFQYIILSLLVFVVGKKLLIFLNHDICFIIINKICILFFYLISSVIFKSSIFLTKNNYKNNLKIMWDYINDCWNSMLQKKIARFIFKFLPSNIFMFISLLFISLYLMIFIKNNSSYLVYSQSDYSSNLGPIVNKKITINLSNVEIDDNNYSINKICIPFGTYKRTNNSLLMFNLYDDNNNKIYNKQINTSQLLDGEKYCLKIKKNSVKNIKKMHLDIISSKANKDNSVTIFSNKNGDSGLSLYNARPLSIFKSILLIFFCFCFIAINYIINKKNIKLKIHHYLLLMCIYIVPVLILYPPLEIPDEGVHFKISYTLAQHGISSFSKSDVSVPKNINCLLYSKPEIIDKVYNSNEIFKCVKQEKNINLPSLFGSNASPGLPFLGYLPSSMFLKITDLITNSPLLIFYFGRLGNFIFSLLILYYALKIAPCHKRILLFVITIPMFIQQMNSYSYDSILNSMSILLISYFLAINSGEISFNRKTKIIISMITLLLITIKIVYFPLVFILFLISKEKFGSMKNKIIYFLELFIVTVILYLLLKRIFALPNVALNNSSGPSNLSYLISNPLNIINIFINTLKVNAEFYLTSLFGYFSWFKFHLNNFTIVNYVIMFLILIFSEESILKDIKRDRLVIFVIISIIISLVFASMYLLWSDYRLNFIDGVQGRYFIPILGFISILLIPRKKYLNFENTVLYYFINIMLFQYIVYLISFFY